MSSLNYYLERINYALMLLLPIGIIIGPFFSDGIIAITSLLFLINYLFYKNSVVINLHKYIYIFFFLFCVYLIFLSFLSKNILLSLESSLFYFRFGIFVINFQNILSNNKYFFKLFSIISIFTFLFVIIDAIFQYLVGVNFLLMSYDDHRLSGIFGDEKILGSYLSRTLPLIIMYSLFLLSNRKYKNIFIFSLLAISSVLILLSGERTAIIYFIIFYILFLILTFNFGQIKIWSLISIILISSILLIKENSVKDRVIDFTKFQLNISNELDHGRIRLFSIQHETIYITSIKIIKDNLFIGIGPKMFREICKKEKYQTLTSLDGSINGCQTHPHNSYIQLLVETGIFGFLSLLLLFMCLTFYLLKHLIIKNLYKKIYFRDFELLILISIFINFWPIVPNGNFFNNWLSSVYYLPIALWYGVKSLKNDF